MTGREPKRVATGVEAHRRRLTEAECVEGALPEPFTRREWRELRRATWGYARALGLPDQIRPPRTP